MVDEDSDEEFVSWAAVVSCLFFFRLFPQKQQHISHEWLSGAFLISFFLIPQLYKLAVFFFVSSEGSGSSSIYNILLSACWIRETF